MGEFQGVLLSTVLREIKGAGSQLSAGGWTEGVPESIHLARG